MSPCITCLMGILDAPMSLAIDPKYFAETVVNHGLYLTNKFKSSFAQSAGAVECTDCTSAEG